MIQSMFDKLLCPEEMLKAVRTELNLCHPDHEAEENAYNAAVCRLRKSVGEGLLEKLNAALAEEEQTMGERLIFLFWRGVQQNLESFRAPERTQFLELDYEELHREEDMNRFIPAEPMGFTASLLDMLPEAADEEILHVFSYYAYLETIAYKLVHYNGYRFGDRLLPKVVPGYWPSKEITKQYSQMLSGYIQLQSISA